MKLTDFLHIETRKCSWFAHWWMDQHHQYPEDYPLELTGQHWVDEYRYWEGEGCPNPKNPGKKHRYNYDE